MTLPINKKKLDSIVETTLKTNGTQAITAPILQNALYPIVNSTFGLKTIWAGYISASIGSSSRVGWVIRENYYDPNYFPPIQDVNSSVINSTSNKYSVTNAGSGLKADNGTTTGTFTNVSTNISTGGSVQDRCGQGLTFDGYVTGGVLTALAVNNQGAGYSNSNSSPTDYASSVTLNLGINSGGVQPIIKFNLANTFYVNSPNTGSSSVTGASYYNIFIPDINTIFQYPNPIQDTVKWTQSGIVYKVPIMHIVYNKNSSWNIGYEAYNSIVGPMSSTSTGYFTGGSINPNKPGIMIGQRTEFTGTTMEGSIEIKVPIINATYTPI